MIHSRFQNVYKTHGISMILECRIDVFNSKLEIASPSRTLNLSTKPSQIGIRCSGTKKCSQRYEIDHFCPRFLFSHPTFRNTLRTHGPKGLPSKFYQAQELDLHPGRHVTMAFLPHKVSSSKNLRKCNMCWTLRSET